MNEENRDETDYSLHEHSLRDRKYYLEHMLFSRGTWGDRSLSGEILAAFRKELVNINNELMKLNKKPGDKTEKIQNIIEKAKKFPGGTPVVDSRGNIWKQTLEDSEITEMDEINSAPPDEVKQEKTYRHGYPTQSCYVGSYGDSGSGGYARYDLPHGVKPLETNPNKKKIIPNEIKPMNSDFRKVTYWTKNGEKVDSSQNTRIYIFQDCIVEYEWAMASKHQRFQSLAGKIGVLFNKPFPPILKNLGVEFSWDDHLGKVYCIMDSDQIPNLNLDDVESVALFCLYGSKQVSFLGDLGFDNLNGLGIEFPPRNFPLLREFSKIARYEDWLERIEKEEHLQCLLKKRGWKLGEDFDLHD